MHFDRPQINLIKFLIFLLELFLFVRNIRTSKYAFALLLLVFSFFKKQIKQYLIAICFHFLIKASICETSMNEDDWTKEMISLNTKFEQNVFYYFQPNKSMPQECARACCERFDCNYALLREKQYCYLVACKSGEVCTPVPNMRKPITEREDIVMYIRSPGKTQLKK
jgi:hypothetical protein